MSVAALIMAASLAAAGVTATPEPGVTASQPYAPPGGDAVESAPSSERGAAPASASSGQGAPVPAPRPPNAPRPSKARPAAADTRSTVEIAMENQLLAQEVKLAQQPRIYLFFDVPKRKVQLKARGTVFREWAMEGVRCLGSDVGPEPRALVARKAASTPKRFLIEPPPLAESPQGAPPDSAEGQSPAQALLADEPEEKPAKSAADELSEKALEVTDMPRRYDLVFEGLEVIVMPRTTGFGGRMSSSLSSLGFYLKLPFRLFSAKRQGRPLTIVRISLEPADAQALYWAFPEGTKALFRLEPPSP